MKNYVQEGIVLTITATSPVKSGDLTHAGSITGICACDADTGEEVEVRVEGVFEIPKIAPADVLAAGAVAKATFTAGVGKVGAAGANTIGVITENSGAGAATAKVRLIPGTAAVTVAAAEEAPETKQPKKAG